MQNLPEILMPVFFSDDNRRQREIGQVTLMISRSLVLVMTVFII